MPKHNTSPAVSVIIPTHNRLAQVQQAIDSVLKQDFTDFDLWVIDDGSTDSTAQTLQERYQGHIKLVQQDHQGVSAARNAGIRFSQGQYLAFLDSDDVWLSQKLQQQWQYMQQHPEYPLCQTEELWMRHGSQLKPKTKHRKKEGWIFKHCLELCLISPSAVMLRRSLLNEIGLFDESLLACEDYDLWLRICAHYPVGLVPQTLVVKQGGHSDQLSQQRGLDRFRIQSLNQLLKSPTLSIEQKDMVLQMLMKKLDIYIQGCLKRNKAEEAKPYQILANTLVDKRF